MDAGPCPYSMFIACNGNDGVYSSVFSNTYLSISYCSFIEYEYEF